MKFFGKRREQKIEPAPGQNTIETEPDFALNIADYVTQLALRAKEENREIAGTFNDFHFVVNPSSDFSPAHVVQKFYNTLLLKEMQRESSPEGVMLKKQEEQTKKIDQEKTDQLIERLDSLDFSNYDTVLNWTLDFYEACSWADFYKNEIIGKFEDNGFGVGTNTGDDYDGEDAENSAKYIFGQFLLWINNDQYGRPGLESAVERWKQKFDKQKQANDTK